MGCSELTRVGTGADLVYTCATAFPKKNPEETKLTTCEETEHKGALAPTFCCERT